MKAQQIQKAIEAGLTFKRLEKIEGGVTASTISAYKIFNQMVNGMTDSEKGSINAEVRRLNK